MRRALPIVALVVLAGATGCQTELGACDQASAERVVYDEMGVPAYEGQALMQTNCANTSYCHSSGIDAPDRFGAPGGLDFDVQLASTDDSLGSRDRLERSLRRVRSYRHDIMGVIEDDRMPPGGEASTQALAGAPRWFDADGNRVPLFADSFEGLDVLRNWLSCGAPVVERTSPHPAGTEPLGDVVEARIDIEPTWTSLYENVVLPRCGRSCHAPGSEETEFNMLDLSERGLAYANLVGVDGMGSFCSGMGTRVVAGDPDASLLYQKLSQEDPACGSRMPQGGDPLPTPVLEAFRAWIQAGALDD